MPGLRSSLPGKHARIKNNGELICELIAEKAGKALVRLNDKKASLKISDAFLSFPVVYLLRNEGIRDRTIACDPESDNADTRSRLIHKPGIVCRSKNRGVEFTVAVVIARHRCIAGLSPDKREK